MAVACSGGEGEGPVWWPSVHLSTPAAGHPAPTAGQPAMLDLS